MLENFKSLAIKSLQTIKLFFENEIEVENQYVINPEHSKTFLSYKDQIFEYEKMHLSRSIHVKQINAEYKEQIWPIDLIRIESDLNDIYNERQQNQKNINLDVFQDWIIKINRQNIDINLMGFWIDQTKNLTKEKLNILKKNIKRIANSIYQNDNAYIYLLIKSTDQVALAHSWLQLICHLLPSKYTWQISFQTYTEIKPNHLREQNKIKVLNHSQIEHLINKDHSLRNDLIIDLFSFEVQDFTNIKQINEIDLLVETFLNRKKYFWMLRDLSLTYINVEQGKMIKNMIDFFEYYTSLVGNIEDGYCLKSWVQINQIWDNIPKHEKIEFALKLLNEHKDVFHFKNKEYLFIFEKLNRPISINEIELKRNPLNFTRLYLEMIYFLKKDHLNVSPVIDSFIEILKKIEVNQSELFELISNYHFSIDLTKTKNIYNEKQIFDSNLEKKSFENIIAYIQTYLFKIKNIVKYKDQDILHKYFDFLIRNPSDYLLAKMIIPQKDYLFIKKLHVYQNHLWSNSKEVENKNISQYDKDIFFEFFEQLSSKDQVTETLQENEYIAELFKDKFHLLKLSKDQKNPKENPVIREIKKISNYEDEIEKTFEDFYKKKIKKDLIKNDVFFSIDLKLLHWLHEYSIHEKKPNQFLLNFLEENIMNWDIDSCEKQIVKLKTKKNNQSNISIIPNIIEMINIRINQIIRFKKYIKFLTTIILLLSVFYYAHPYVQPYLDRKEEFIAIAEEKLIHVKKNTTKEIKNIINDISNLKLYFTKIFIGEDNHVSEYAPKTLYQEKFELMEKLFLECSDKNCELDLNNKSFDLNLFFKMYQHGETQLNFFFYPKTKILLPEIWKKKEIDLEANLTTMSANPRNVIVFVIALHVQNEKLANHRNEIMTMKIKKILSSNETLKMESVIKVILDVSDFSDDIKENESLGYLQTSDQSFLRSQFKDLKNFLGESVAIVTYPCWKEFCTYLRDQKRFTCNQIKSVPNLCKAFCK